MSGLYQIRVNGHLDRHHEEWLTGFSLAHLPTGETVLTGQMADQAALFGVLLRIRDLGIPLLSVNKIEPKSNNRE